MDMAIGHTNGNGPKNLEDSQEIPAQDGQLDRLDRYEERLSETRSAVAVCEVKIDHLGNQMTESNAHLAEKMHEGFDRLCQMIQPIATKVHELETKNGETAYELKALKISEKSRLARSKKVKNGVIGLFLTAGGAIATSAGKYLWDVLSK